jgi:hypothetical protein
MLHKRLSSKQSHIVQRPAAATRTAAAALAFGPRHSCMMRSSLPFADMLIKRATECSKLCYVTKCVTYLLSTHCFLAEADAYAAAVAAASVSSAASQAKYDKHAGYLSLHGLSQSSRMQKECLHMHPCSIKCLHVSVHPISLMFLYI